MKPSMHKADGWILTFKSKHAFRYISMFVDADSPKTLDMEKNVRRAKNIKIQTYRYSSSREAKTQYQASVRLGLLAL